MVESDYLPDEGYDPPYFEDRQLASMKIPPYSVQAEQSVLGGLMLDNETWEKVADRLGEDDFYRRDHRLIFRAISMLAEKQQPFDVVTLAEVLENNNWLAEAGGLAYLGSMAKDTPSAANIVAYADIVRERSVLRQLIHAASEVADAAYNPKGRELGNLVEEAEQKIFQIADQRRRTGSGFRAIRSLLAGAVDRIEELFQKRGHITGMSTGFTDLDDMTSGLQRGDLIIVAGRPSMGKTTFAMNIAENVAADPRVEVKVPVAVFSMEMPGEQLAMRMMSSLGRIDQHRVRTGQLEDEEWHRVTGAISMLADTKLFIDDTPALTPTEVRARCRRLAREYGQLGLVVVDYLQLMQSSGNAENRVNEISEISRSLKALAKEMNVPVIALSQLNRNLEQRTNKRPMPSDLRECVPGNTLVCLADGRRVPISKLVGTQPVVLSMSEDQKIAPAISDQVWAVGKKSILKLSLASGRVLRATAKHQIFTGKGWQTLGELRPGDRVAVSRKTIEPAQSDLFWDRVASIESDGEDEVYDLTVPGPASWLADGIVCHNSGAIEQDADIIIFIYRDEVYNPESPDKGKAEIIIAKQRNGPIGMVTLTFSGQYTRFDNFISDPYAEDYRPADHNFLENRTGGRSSQIPAYFEETIKTVLRDK